MTTLINLNGKRGLVVGVANDASIAAGCARAFRAAGAELALTYLNEKARPWVEPVAKAVESTLFLPCDVREPGQLEAVFERIEAEWGKLDFLLHAIAFAPREDLHTSVVNASAEGFGMAMDVSCHSFLRMARLARPLMTDGGALITVSFYGADRVVENYNLMGPVKAALESSVRYVAADLADEGIRAFSLSAGPVMTRAASGIDRFDELLDEVRARTPSGKLVSTDEIVHLVRHSLNFCGWKDRKAVAKDLRRIYQAVDDEDAAKALDDFEAEWGGKYPSIAPSWRRAWQEVIPFFAFPPAVRKIIYTTNAIESLNRVIRKTTKTRGSFPTDDAATKLIYLAIRSFEKAGRCVREWVAARNQFAILYPERLNK